MPQRHRPQRRTARPTWHSAPRYVAVVAFLAVCLGALGASPAPGMAQPRPDETCEWISIAELSAPVYRGAAVVLPGLPGVIGDETLYVMGGLQRPSTDTQFQMRELIERVAITDTVAPRSPWPAGIVSGVNLHRYGHTTHVFTDADGQAAILIVGGNDDTPDVATPAPTRPPPNLPGPSPTPTPGLLGEHTTVERLAAGAAGIQETVGAVYTFVPVERTLGPAGFNLGEKMQDHAAAVAIDPALDEPRLFLNGGRTSLVQRPSDSNVKENRVLRRELDRWVLDPNTWTGPKNIGLFGHTMAWSPWSDVMLLFGGTTEPSERPNGEVWDLELERYRDDPSALGWRTASVDGRGPSGRYFHAAVMDTRRKRWIIFGGQSGQSQTWGDTWALELGGAPPFGTAKPQWNRLHSGGPRDRLTGAALAYDAERGWPIRVGGALLDSEGNPVQMRNEVSALVCSVPTPTPEPTLTPTATLSPDEDEHAHGGRRPRRPHEPPRAPPVATRTATARSTPGRAPSYTPTSTVALTHKPDLPAHTQPGYLLHGRRVGA